MPRAATIRKGKKGYTVFIPDAGWVDCGPDCNGCKTHQTEPTLHPSYHEPFPTRKKAIEYALWLGFRDVIVE
jgi:hypothetical protein